MYKLMIFLAVAFAWLSMPVPVQAGDASALISLKENNFTDKKIVTLVDKKGEKDWDKLATRKDGTIFLDCTHALFLLGGTEALKATIAAVKKPFFIESTCDDMKRVGIFFEQVKLNGQRKQLLMIAPADEDYVKDMGMDKFLQAQIGEDVNSNLYDNLSTKLLAKNIKLLKKI